MCAICAVLPFWAKATEIERTEFLFLVVFQGAEWAKWAEAAVVMWT
jgi:hypothetical protein